MKYIFDRNCTLFEVHYTEEEDVIAFQSVRVLDANYTATGPELIPFLHDTLVPYGANGEVVLAATVLSIIADEIENVKRTH